MKRTLLILTVIVGFGAVSQPVHSQAPVAAPAVAGGSPLEQLKAIQDQNVKLLEQQAAALQKLEELEKASQTIKVLGKRS